MSYIKKEAKKKRPTLLDVYSSYLDCARLYVDTQKAALDLSEILLAIFENETSKEDRDARLVLMIEEKIDWVEAVSDKLSEVYARVEAGTFPIVNANELFIKAYGKIKEVELRVKVLS